MQKKIYRHHHTEINELFRVPLAMKLNGIYKSQV